MHPRRSKCLNRKEREIILNNNFSSLEPVYSNHENNEKDSRNMHDRPTYYKISEF